MRMCGVLTKLLVTLSLQSIVIGIYSLATDVDTRAEHQRKRAKKENIEEKKWMKNENECRKKIAGESILFLFLSNLRVFFVHKGE